MKKVDKKTFILTIIIVIVIISIIVINKKSFANKENYDYKRDYILNHDWVKFMELTDEEKSLYEIIPDKFIYQHKKNDVSYFSLRDEYPSYYNLNDYGLSTFPEAQGSLGLCWAFAGLS